MKTIKTRIRRKFNRKRAMKAERIKVILFKSFISGIEIKRMNKR